MQKNEEEAYCARVLSAQTFHGHFSKIAQKTLGKQANSGTSQHAKTAI